MKKIIIFMTIAFVVIKAAHAIKIFTIGDSTVQDYTEGYSPRKGWGQMLPFFFDLSKINIINKAIGGTSSKNFYTYFWSDVLKEVNAGDVVFIQFGINDRNSADDEKYAPYEVFKDYIRLYVAEVRAKGATPVLVSTVRRNAWTADGLPYDAYHEHPVAMRELAQELDAPLVDLNKYCYDLFLEQGELYSTRFLTLNLEPGEYPNYPNGASDNVHYQEIGATDMARKVCDVIKSTSDQRIASLAQYLKPTHTVTIVVNDPAKDIATVRTADYPEGIPVTLKTIPEQGATFVDWTLNGSSVSTKQLYTFIMGNQPITAIAHYQSALSNIIIDNASNTLIAPYANNYQWYYNNQIINGANSSSFKPDKKGTYTVALLNQQGIETNRLSVCITIGANGSIRKIYIIGDSTVCNYRDSDFPMTGWGQVLNYFFNEKIEIYNHAIGGRSSRSFIEQGRWATVKDALQPGDFVFIQFGHNDRDFSKEERYTPVDDYKTYITQYVQETYAKGAIPVLISPMVMNAWSGTTMRNVFTESGNNYRGAMAEVANEQNTPFVDLNILSHNLFKTMNYDYCSRFYYNTYPAGEYPNYPDGNTDGTHFQEHGAISLARMIINELHDIDNEFTCALHEYIKPQYTLNVHSNITDPGDISYASTYPEGCPVTVKILPRNGNTFNYWAVNGKNETQNTTYRFLMPGTNTSVTALFNGGTIEVPDITISAPLPETIYADPSDITIMAQANSNTAEIKKVEFYNGATKIGEATSVPYSIIWKNITAGTYTITAVATNSQSISATSQAITITVSSDKDCAGILYGSAHIDDCGICAGGTTGVEPCTAFQFENSCSIDGTIDSNNEGFTGNGFVNLNNELGSELTFTIYSLKDTLLNFTVLYANGTDISRNSDIRVNNILQIENQEFAPTGSWTTWNNEPITLYLSKGTNEVRFVSTSESGGANFDALQYSNNPNIIFTCENIEKSQIIDLGSGWNLISIFVGPADNNVASLLNGATIVKDMNSYYDATIPKQFNTLQHIEPGKGYMIYCKNALQITITGIPLTTYETTIGQGWNLFGSPWENDVDINQFISNTQCNIETIKNFSSFFDGTARSSLVAIEKGSAYYIYSANTCILKK